MLVFAELLQGSLAPLFLCKGGVSVGLPCWVGGFGPWKRSKREEEGNMWANDDCKPRRMGGGVHCRVQCWKTLNPIFFLALMRLFGPLAAPGWAYPSSMPVCQGISVPHRCFWCLDLK